MRQGRRAEALKSFREELRAAWQHILTLDETIPAYRVAQIEARKRLQETEKLLTSSGGRENRRALSEGLVKYSSGFSLGRLLASRTESNHVVAVKEKRPIIIQRNLAAWITLYRTEPVVMPP